MTPAHLISIIRNRLPKRFHEEVIRYGLGGAYSVFMSQQADLTMFRKDYWDVDVVHGTISYTILPVSALNIPNAIQVSLKSTVFDEREDGENQVYGGLEVGLISKIIGFTRRNDRIIYDNMAIEVTKVNMHIVIPLESYDFNEEFYLPTGADELIIETAINFLQGTPPSSFINDGSEITA